ncbi:hypothetical protein NPIL_372861, partial [Nephila pilipes]
GMRSVTYCFSKPTFSNMSEAVNTFQLRPDSNMVEAGIRSRQSTTNCLDLSAEFLKS